MLKSDLEETNSQVFHFTRALYFKYLGLYTFLALHYELGIDSMESKLENFWQVVEGGYKR